MDNNKIAALNEMDLENVNGGFVLSSFAVIAITLGGIAAEAGIGVGLGYLMNYLKDKVNG